MKCFSDDRKAQGIFVDGSIHGLAMPRTEINHIEENEWHSHEHFRDTNSYVTWDDLQDTTLILNTR